MNISNWGTVAVLGALTLASYAVVIVVLPRTRTAKMRTYLVQALGMFLAILLSLLTVAAYLNLENRWYPTLESVFANPKAEAAVTRYGAAPVAQRNGRQLSPSPHTQEPTDAALRDALARYTPGKPVELQMLNGQGRTVKTLIWLPGSYLHNPHRTYPVVLAFPGYPGMPEVYENLAPAFGGKTSAGSAHQPVGEVIVVAPDVFYSGVDTECVDASASDSGSPRIESFLTGSLIPYLEQNLRVPQGPEGWATWGYSAGGYCALMLPVRHPNLVANAVVFAGYFKPRYTAGQHWRPDDDTEYNLMGTLTEQKPAVHLWYFTAADDATITQELSEATVAVHPPTHLEVVSIPAGGHRFSVWRPNEYRALTWLGQREGFGTG